MIYIHQLGLFSVASLIFICFVVLSHIKLLLFYSVLFIQYPICWYISAVLAFTFIFRLNNA